MIDKLVINWKYATFNNYGSNFPDIFPVQVTDLGHKKTNLIFIIHNHHFENQTKKWSEFPEISMK